MYKQSNHFVAITLQKEILNLRFRVNSSKDEEKKQEEKRLQQISKDAHNMHNVFAATNHKFLMHKISIEQFH